MKSAIKILGETKGLKIEDNTCVNIGLLEANKIKDSSVKNNKIFLSKIPKKEKIVSKFFWEFIIPVIAIVFASYLVYKFGINS